MSENRPPLPDGHTLEHDFYSECWKRFRRDLERAAFVRLDDVGGEEVWEGVVPVFWEDPVTSEEQVAPHRIRIVVTSSFPFQKPTVIPADQAPPIHSSRHQAPGSPPGALCLWTDQGGWQPWTSADDILARIHAWFVHYHRNDWAPQDQPPDLHLYFPARAPRPMMLIGNEWLSLNDGVTGRFGVWQKNPVQAFAGNITAGVGTPRLRHDDRALAQLSLKDRDHDQAGVWFRLLSEPRPQLTLDKLLTEIDDKTGKNSGWSLQQLQALFGQKQRGSSPLQIVMALGYPSGSESLSWLFVRAEVPFEKKGRRWTDRRVLQQARIESFETASISPDALMRRVRHTAPLLQGCRVLVFGQGAIGSSVTLLLAKSGVQHLRVVDSDRLRPGNAVRHSAGIPWSGWAKTEASAGIAQSHAPDCKIRCEEASWDRERLTAWVQEAQVVVDATAHPAFSLLLNDICIRTCRPAIYVTTHRRASVGRIRVVDPGRDACQLCYEGGYLYSEEYPLIAPMDEGAFFEDGCGVPSIEASAVDIEATANWAARSALSLLQSRSLPGNHCLIIHDPLPGGRRPLDEVGIHWSMWKPLPRCEACSRST